MSYDLMVFEPAAAPRDREAFLDWYTSQTQWAEDHSYNDPSITAANLSAWFSEMCRHFSDLNGPGVEDIADDQHHSSLASYSIGRSVIYAAFPWSEADSAYAVMRALAVKHGVGFFNVSDDNGEIWFPPTDRTPDTTTIPRLTLTLEGQQPLEGPSLASIEAAVDWLDPSRGPGFLILEDRNGSYAQVGGGRDTCMLEWREYAHTSFQHWAAGMPSGHSTEIISIRGNGTTFSVQANEKLSNASVKAILTGFAQDLARPSDFEWRDITSRFGGRGPSTPRKPWWQFWR